VALWHTLQVPNEVDDEETDYVKKKEAKETGRMLFALLKLMSTMCLPAIMTFDGAEGEKYNDKWRLVKVFVPAGAGAGVGAAWCGRVGAGASAARQLVYSYRAVSAFLTAACETLAEKQAPCASPVQCELHPPLTTAHSPLDDRSLTFGRPPNLEGHVLRWFFFFPSSPPPSPTQPVARSLGCRENRED
jgi:hypothetical protein